MGAASLAVSREVDGPECLAVYLGLAAVCDVDCTIRSKGRRDGPATPSPKMVSNGGVPEGLRRTFKPCSQFVVLASFGFQARSPHVTPHLLEASDTRLTPSTVVLLRISGDLAGEKWEEASHERQVARRRVEHRSV